MKPLPPLSPTPQTPTKPEVPLPSPPVPFIGQEAIMNKIKQLITRANKSKAPFPHTLLVAEEGWGKKTMASCISYRLGAKVTRTTGGALYRTGDLIGVLTNLGDRDVLLIPDFQQMNKVVQDFVYPALEDCTIDFVIDKGPYAKTIKFHLKRFTVIATIPDETKLEKRMRDLFVCRYQFAPYSKSELRQIFSNTLQTLQVTCDDGILDVLVEASGGNPGRGVRFARQAIRNQPTSTAHISKFMMEEYRQLTSHDAPRVETADVDRRIQDEVKREVWRRDEGKCMKCGSRESLEFDHIIPVSRGGGSTVRNIELLCEACNRKKNDSI